MSTIELNLVSEERFLAWHESIQMKLQSLDGETCRAILTDVEEATNRPMTGNVTMRFPDSTPFFRARHQLIDAFWPTSKACQADPGPPPYEKLHLHAPGLPYMDRRDYARTLAELGFASGDFLVLRWKSRPLGIAIGRPSAQATPRTLAEFFESVVDDPRVKADQACDGLTGVNSLVLYTEEDTDLALYVRQYYGALHIMSGFDLAFYFLEYIPPVQDIDRPSLHAFWSSVLPHKWYSAWRTIGLIRSKPFPPARVYQILHELGLDAAQLPCMVFFLDWRKIAEERIVLRITPPIPTFFRQVCSDVHMVIADLAGKETPAESANRSRRLAAGLRRFLARTNEAGSTDSAITLQKFQSHVPAWWTGRTSPEPLPATRATGAEMRHSSRPTIFLCHSSLDKPFVNRIAFELRKLGLGIWLDKWDILVGDSIVDRIEKGIEENDYLGIVLSPDSIESEWVHREWTAAYLRELEERKVIILPILYRTCKIPLMLRGREYADFTASYDDGLYQLVERLAPDAVSCLKTVRDTVDSKE
jgi:hypothetical protein